MFSIASWSSRKGKGKFALFGFVFDIIVLFKLPLDCKEIKPVDPKGNQPWIFIGRTVAEAETLMLWPPDVKNWVIWKDPDAEKDWRQEEKGMTEDEMVGWHHRLNGHEFEQAPGVGDGQGSLACCSPWACKELTRLSNWTTATKLESNEKQKVSLLFNSITSVCKNHLFFNLYFMLEYSW